MLISKISSIIIGLALCTPLIAQDIDAIPPTVAVKLIPQLEQEVKSFHNKYENLDNVKFYSEWEAFDKAKDAWTKAQDRFRESMDAWRKSQPSTL